jgi:hypothetical protein
MAGASADQRRMELRAMKVADEAIEQMLEQEARARGDVSDEIEVWHENWDAVRVYKMCLWETTTHIEVGPGVAVSRPRYMGISSNEIIATAQLLRVEANDDLLWRLRTLVHHARPLLNEVK